MSFIGDVFGVGLIEGGVVIGLVAYFYFVVYKTIALAVSYAFAGEYYAFGLEVGLSILFIWAGLMVAMFVVIAHYLILEWY